MKVFCTCSFTPDVLIEPIIAPPPTEIKIWQIEQLNVYVRYPMELIKKNQPRFNRRPGTKLENWGAHERIYPNIDIYRCQYCGHITAVENLDPSN